MAPLHHHFEKKGWAESTIVIRFWIISVVLALISLSTLKLEIGLQQMVNAPIKAFNHIAILGMGCLAGRCWRRVWLMEFLLLSMMTRAQQGILTRIFQL